MECFRNARGFLTSLSPSSQSRNGVLLRNMLTNHGPNNAAGSVASPLASSASLSSSVPSDRLLILIRGRHWEAALERLVQHPLDARFRDAPKRATPLHVALLNRAPHAVIAVLVDMFPTALLLQDSEGWTPLHVNILYGSHEDTTLLLIKRGGPMAASLHSKLVGSPLHLMCRHGPQSIKVFRALVETRPEEVTTTNSEVGISAANLLYKSFLRRHDLRNQADAECLMEQLMVIVKAVYKDDKETARQDNHEPSLHQIILFQCNYARETDMVRLALRLYPDLFHSTDALGRFPLHIAAALSRITPARPMSSFCFHAPQDALVVLLEHDPLSASIPDPTTGRLPLFTAIAVAGNRTYDTGIESFVKAYPRALQLRDPVTGMFAYQLAAIAVNAGRNDDSGSLATVFELMKACPSVLR